MRGRDHRLSLARCSDKAIVDDVANAAETLLRTGLVPGVETRGRVEAAQLARLRVTPGIEFRSDAGGEDQPLREPTSGVAGPKRSGTDAEGDPFGELPGPNVVLLPQRGQSRDEWIDKHARPT